MTDKEVLDKGEAWYNAHTKHVIEKVLASDPDAPSIRPSAGDIHDPALWKDIHWKWFLDQRPQPCRINWLAC